MCFEHTPEKRLNDAPARNQCEKHPESIRGIGEGMTCILRNIFEVQKAMGDAVEDFEFDLAPKAKKPPAERNGVVKERIILAGKNEAWRKTVT